MGADLYRDGHEAIRDAGRSAFDATVKHRNDVFERAERAGTIRYEDGALQWPDTCIAPPECVQAQEAVHDANMRMHPPSHYFRDSYNDSSLLWKLDLSWWGDVDKFAGPAGDGAMVKVRDEDGHEYDEFRLYPAGMRRLIAELESRRHVFENSIAHETPDDRQYFIDKFSRLTAFLHDTAEAGDTIACSD
jgi:hypothetical protein